MTRRAAILSLSIACCWSLLSVPAVAGGGGCHQAPRPFDARTQVVAMEDYCYSPAVVRIKPGQSITWVNRDFDAHTVTGVAESWGEYAELGRKARVTNSFSTPGVYPYFCAFHPGMVGAVVVGDGVARGASVDSSAVSSGTGAEVKTGSGSTSSVEPSRVSWLWAAPVLLAAGGAAVALDRRRRKLT